MSAMRTVLVIDDNETMREGVAATVGRLGVDVVVAESGLEGLDLFRRHHPDLVVTDLRMEGMDGLGVVQAVRSEDPEALVLIMTAYGTVEAAVEAMKLGAFDFIEKPFPPEVLRVKLAAAGELLTARRSRDRLAAENEVLRRDAGVVSAAGASDALVGDAPTFQRSLKSAERVARTDSTVLLTGESGTGKELVARLIHGLSPRADGAFIRVNCGALVETLLESELFGHERGAFTGALKRRLGRFELADGGTLLLDEVGDLPMGLQVKLLRVLQEREFERVGGETTIQVDVRVIAATHRDLAKLVAEGGFREDLLYRLRVIPIALPPLRDRAEDIPALVEHFVAKLGARTRATARGFSEAALARLAAYGWPGNVRELENVVEQTLVFAEGEEATPDDLPGFLDRDAGSSASPSRASAVRLDGLPLPDRLDDIERRLVLEAYEASGGVKAETARSLGIKPSALYYKLEKYGIT